MLKNALAMYLASREHALHVERCFNKVSEYYKDEIKKIMSRIDSQTDADELKGFLLNFGGEMYYKGFYDSIEMVYKGFSEVSGEWLENEVNRLNEV